MFTSEQAIQCVESHGLAATLEDNGWLAVRDLMGDHIDSVKSINGAFPVSALREALGY